MSVPTAPSSAFTGIIIGLVSSFGSIIIIAIVVFVIWATGCAGSGRILLDRFGRPGEYDDEQAFAREEAEALETMDDMARTEYLRAKAFVTANPPESLQTEISLSQYLAIQEKGISAWEFEPELEVANCFVEARTEIEFFDSECTVMSNLPVPKQNEVYYWEAKIYDKPQDTLLAIGMSTKPYPLFRLPGYHKYSVAYHSTGFRHYDQPFSKSPYGPSYVQGDVIGVGYRPRTGAIFFTRNGKRLDEVVHGLKLQNFFPAVGANGPAVVHVNLGQSGFVFIEANVKKWGLAPVTGSLAPPPPYGSEQGSVLLEAGPKDGSAGGGVGAGGVGGGGGGGTTPNLAQSYRHSPSSSPFGLALSGNTLARHGRSRSGNVTRAHPPTSPGPIRSPTDISLSQFVLNDETGEASSSVVSHHHHHQQHPPLPPSPPPPPPPQQHHHHHHPHLHHHHHHHQRQQPHLEPDHPDENSLHLHLEDATNPPPDYSSPIHSDEEAARRRSSDSSDEDAPLIAVARRSRGDSAATVTPPPPARPPPRRRRRRRRRTADAPRHAVPTYRDAVRAAATVSSPQALASDPSASSGR